MSTLTAPLPAPTGTITDYGNWIHLDMKGMMPSEARLIQWLDWLAGLGFGGVVLEYEDRYPWQSWPGTYRPGLDHEGWGRVLRHCETLGLQVTPLIQTFGHLEWLLKHERYAHLRCGGHLNLLCPQNPDIRPLLSQWIEEVCALHPDSPYLHVGMDEVYHLGECPHCQSKAAQSPRGEIGVYVEHARFVCELVIGQGKRPIIWGDMLTRRNVPELAQELPPGTVLCDWNYIGEVGQLTHRLTGASTNEVMAASAIRRSYVTHHLVDVPALRIQNVIRWHDRLGEGDLQAVSALIHTLWGRPRGLGQLYGPWEGWLPAILAAADPQVAFSDPIRKGMELLETGRSSTTYDGANGAALKLAELHGEDAWEEAALRWWELSLHHYSEVLVAQYYTLSYEGLRTAIDFQGADPDLVDEIREGRTKLIERLIKLRGEILAFLREHHWDGEDEYIAGRIDNILRVLNGLAPI